MYIMQHDYVGDLALANITNVARRHCKIGRIRSKPAWEVRRPARPDWPNDFRFPHIGTPSMPQPNTCDPYRPYWWEQVAC